MSPSTDTCSVCGAPTAPARYGGTCFDECRVCGYATLAGAKKRADYWEDDSLSHPDEEYWRGAKDAYFDSALAFLAELTPGRRLLDVGGGIGHFAEKALGRGWDAHSLDVSERATAVASGRLGADRARAALGPDDEGTFDVVTLWCVVAHTRAPEEVLRVARAAARRGGYLWLTTPNFSYQKRYAAARSLLRRPLNFERDDHVVHFTDASAKRLLEREGFEDVRFHFRGITETCIVAASSGRSLVEAKRLWNRVTYGAGRRGFPNLMSELQLTARRA